MYHQHGQQILRYILNSLTTTRCIHLNLPNLAATSANYYAALGISKSSTQTEIKSAYYNLSMIYHPDKNKGCDIAAKKFREISEAYEVLGNFRLRRMYDKGIMRPGGHVENVNVPDDIPHEEDDAETKFYKSRFKKSHVADAKGRTPIYNFDVWTQAHYGQSFDRRQEAQKKQERKKNQKEHGIQSLKTDIIMLTFLFATVGTYVMFMWESEYDSPKRKAENNHAEREKQESSGTRKPT